MSKFISLSVFLLINFHYPLCLLNREAKVKKTYWNVTFSTCFRQCLEQTFATLFVSSLVQLVFPKVCLSCRKKCLSHHCRRLPVVLTRQSRQPLCFFHLGSSNLCLYLSIHWPDSWLLRFPVMKASSTERAEIYVIFMSYTIFWEEQCDANEIPMAWAQVKVSKLWYFQWMSYEKISVVYTWM